MQETAPFDAGAFARAFGEAHRGVFDDLAAYDAGVRLGKVEA